MALGKRLAIRGRRCRPRRSFVLGLAHGVQAVAVLGPFESNAFDVFAGDPSGEGAGHFLSNHAQQTGVFVALVDAVARRLVDQRAQLGSVVGADATSRVADFPLASSSSWVHSPLSGASRTDRFRGLDSLAEMVCRGISTRRNIWTRVFLVGRPLRLGRSPGFTTAGYVTGSRVGHVWRRSSSHRSRRLSPRERIDSFSRFARRIAPTYEAALRFRNSDPGRGYPRSDHQFKMAPRELMRFWHPGEGRRRPCQPQWVGKDLDVRGADQAGLRMPVLFD